MRWLISRTTALAVSATVALGAASVPAAGQTAATGADRQLTRLSPASRQVVTTATPADGLASPQPRRGGGGTLRSRDGGQTAGPLTPGAFFKSTRGRIALALMAAGTGVTLWSIQHDRKPVKSPIR